MCAKLALAMLSCASRPSSSVECGVMGAQGEEETGAQDVSVGASGASSSTQTAAGAGASESSEVTLVSISPVGAEMGVGVALFPNLERERAVSAEEARRAIETCGPASGGCTVLGAGAAAGTAGATVGAVGAGAE